MIRGISSGWNRFSDATSWTGGGESGPGSTTVSEPEEQASATVASVESSSAKVLGAIVGYRSAFGPGLATLVGAECEGEQRELR